MKTIRNQIKYPKVYHYKCFYRRGLGPVLYKFFNQQKEQQKNNKQNATETFQKTLSKPSSHVLAVKIYSIAPSSDINNVVSGHLLVRLGKKQTKREKCKSM